MTQYASYDGMNKGESILFAELDALAAALAERLPSPGFLTDVVTLLARHRTAVGWQEWREFATGAFRRHSIVPLLLQEPSSRYGLRKPRGYAGDAVLMDFGYGAGGSERLVSEAGPVGQELYRQMFDSPWSSVLRARRNYLAARIGKACSRPSNRILAVACGHLRELQQLPPHCQPGRFLALDQDGESLATARAGLSGFAIECCKCSAFRLLSSRFEIGDFDFIYSAGLYDYLDDTFGARLVLALARRLAPGGTLLVANMLPGFGCSGYMEAVMDWWLIYRSAAEMLALARGAIESGGFTARAFTANDDSIAYLEICREGSVHP
ncbi:MAG TPA: class I SAM-dependent methyltransferase [Bryobacteraceae bacterium]|nr:class I SAM-dependent methyltransferase [Bryobacteraceae bacterium]